MSGGSRTDVGYDACTGSGSSGAVIVILDGPSYRLRPLSLLALIGGDWGHV